MRGGGELEGERWSAINHGRDWVRSALRAPLRGAARSCPLAVCAPIMHRAWLALARWKKMPPPPKKINKR